MDISSLYAQIMNAQSSGEPVDLSALDVNSLVADIQMSFWDTYMGILGGNDDEDDSGFGFLSDNIFSQNGSADNGLGLLSSMSSMNLNSLGLDLGQTGSDSSGFDWGSLGLSSLLPGLTDIYGQLEQYGAENFDSFTKASNIQINQFTAEMQAGGDGANANCGPASLAMAYKALGAQTSLPDGDLVDMVRYLMIDDTGRDGFDENGARAEIEHNSFTDFDDLQKGAARLGLRSRVVEADALTVQSELFVGNKVIVSGTFTNKSPLPWTGDRLYDSQTAPGGATDHFVTITEYDAQRGQFLVNDPARNAPLWVSPSTLEHFMQGNPGVLSLSK